MRQTVDISTEPRGGAYRGLVLFAVDRCSSFLLVEQQHLGLSMRARTVLAELQPSKRREWESREWPGTSLLKDYGTVREFALTRETAAILARTADSLYSWVQPELPEDLCLLRPGGEPWLISIAHEPDAYLNLSSDELEALLSAVPELLQCVTTRHLGSASPGNHGRTS